MGRYCARRLLETIPLLLVISIFVFMFIHLLPGDPARQLAGLEATPEQVQAIHFIVFFMTNCYTYRK